MRGWFSFFQSLFYNGANDGQDDMCGEYINVYLAGLFSDVK
jgi:hypothetical protein